MSRPKYDIPFQVGLSYTEAGRISRTGFSDPERPRADLTSSAVSGSSARTAGEILTGASCTGIKASYLPVGSLSERRLSAARGPGRRDAGIVHPHFEQTVDLLCSPELATIVELVAWSPEPDVYEARAVDGHVRFRRESSDGKLSFSSKTIAGRDVLADQDPTRFAPLDAELSNQQPNRLTNSYPYAYEHLAQVFDHPCAPDLCVLQTAAHHFKHLGEHGSLSVVQARAPFIVSGAGIARNGMVDDHCRLVDLAPTILARSFDQLWWEV